MTDGMSDHENKFDQDNHPTTAEESALREYPLDLTAADAKAKSGSGRQYWRSIEELAGDPHFEDLLHREFPRAASEWDESVDRRDFLKLMGASLALAGMAGWRGNGEPHILAEGKEPEGVVFGKTQHYYAGEPFCGGALGFVVGSPEG